MINKFLNSKVEIIRVRLSTPTCIRAKCKHCMSVPSFYYYIRNPTMWFSPRKSLDQKAFFKYLLRGLPVFSGSPKDYNSVSSFAHNTQYAKYRPRLHRTRGSNAVFDTVEILTCDCMRTNWAFSEKAVVDRPEIMARKARHKFPNKFSF